jgi:hypothetical protein
MRNYFHEFSWIIYIYIYIHIFKYLIRLKNKQLIQILNHYIVHIHEYLYYHFKKIL